jgi:hypothetical protein
MVDWPQRQRQGIPSILIDVDPSLALVTSHVQSTIACALEQHLLHQQKFAYRLDGDNIRFGLNKDLGFDEKSRNENIRRIGEVRRAHPNHFLAGCDPDEHERSPNFSRTLLVYPSPHLFPHTAQTVTLLGNYT